MPQSFLIPGVMFPQELVICNNCALYFNQLLKIPGNVKLKTLQFSFMSLVPKYSESVATRSLYHARGVRVGKQEEQLVFGQDEEVARLEQQAGMQCDLLM